MIYRNAIKLFKDKLMEEYADRLIDIILYGSYARGDEDEESDIDLLVLLKSIEDFWKEVHRISEIESKVHEIFDFKILISAIPVSVEDFYNKKTPLFLNARKEGIRI